MAIDNHLASSKQSGSGSFPPFGKRQKFHFFDFDGNNDKNHFAIAQPEQSIKPLIKQTEKRHHIETSVREDRTALERD
jgi:hypothetical protein